MINSKYFTGIVAVLAALAVVLSGAMVVVSRNGTIDSYTPEPEYVEKLFSQEILSIAITADPEDWQTMLDNALQEEYISCDVIIGGTTFSSVGIRPKGNSSLTNVANSDSDRYSFKLKFDQYIKDQTCFGLDSFVVNNIQGDTTYMKEYFSYDLMAFLGVDCPKVSYADLTVNGEPWGFYLAIETYRDSFVARTYGSAEGQLYNVKSMEMGGGGIPGNRPDREENAPQDFSASQLSKQPQQEDEAGAAAFPPQDALGAPERGGGEDGEPPFGNWEKGGRMGRGSTGGDLVYQGEDLDSYSAIFGNAVSNPSEEEKTRVVTALKHLAEGTELEKYWNVDQILRYLAAHTFVVNLDSYSSSMQQNYYLYEQEGRLTVLPWDYNLAFGGFSSRDASSVINFPIDTPVSGVDIEDRPLIHKLLEVEEYRDTYHRYLQKIVEEYFQTGLFEKKLTALTTLIDSYVKKDATAFYSYEEYAAAVPVFQELCLRRAESVSGQLTGTIPSTEEEQKADPSALIEGSDLDLSVLGSQGGGKMGGQREDRQFGRSEKRTDSSFPFPAANGQGRLPMEKRGEEELKNPQDSVVPFEKMDRAIDILQTAEGELSEEEKAELEDLGLEETQLELVRQMADKTPFQEGEVPQRWESIEPEETNFSWEMLLLAVGVLMGGLLVGRFFPRRY